MTDALDLIEEAAAAVGGATDIFVEVLDRPEVPASYPAIVVTQRSGDVSSDGYPKGIFTGSERPRAVVLFSDEHSWDVIETVVSALMYQMTEIQDDFGEVTYDAYDASIGGFDVRSVVLQPTVPGTVTLNPLPDSFTLDS